MYTAGNMIQAHQDILYYSGPSQCATFFTRRPISTGDPYPLAAFFDGDRKNVRPWQVSAGQRVR